MKYKILVVDDDKELVKMLCSYFNMKQYETITATDCKLCLNGMPVPLLRNCYSIFNGTKYR